MPPKKKEEQIDLSTLPECKSLNAHLYCKGRKSRADTIITKLKTDTKFISSVKKAEVLDHAKQKNIYIDPNSLTDKQKKDPKFMETVCTELTPEVIAKAVSSYLTQLNIKIRLEKKAAADKPEEQRPPAHDRNFDWMYIFEDFPETTEQYEALAKVGNNVSFAFVMNPKISWANAPEIPEPQQAEDAQPQQQDEEIVELKQLQAKQKFSEEDYAHQQSLNNDLQAFKSKRAKSSKNSQFRNAAIIPIDFEMDPYNQNESINNAVQQFIETANRVSVDYQSFQTWKTDKSSQRIFQQRQERVEKQQNQEIVNQRQQAKPGPPKRKEEFSLSGQSVHQLLLSLGKKLDAAAEKKIKDDGGDEDIMSWIQNYSFDKVSRPTVSNPGQQKVKVKAEGDFRPENQILFGEGPISEELDQLISQIKYPGIKRHQMPQIPTKSENLRKVFRSQYGQFLPEGLSFSEFERRLAILKFEDLLKQVDEERSYKLSDRVYEQEHDKNSLRRELYRSMIANEATILSKYNEQTDSLYLALLYKNPIRRIHKKNWEANWKVLPNFENWLQYFKSNDANLSNLAYYDIDYQKIGNIEESSRLYAAKDGGIIVSKNINAGNYPQKQLFVIKEHGNFGTSPGKFFFDNFNLKITHKIKDKKTGETETFLTFKDGKIICLKQNGDVVSYIKGEPTRLYSPQGYTVIYNEKSSQVLYPDGSISYPPNHYTNAVGNGLKNGQICQVPTLKRKTEKGELIIKRDDGTVLVENKNQKWIRFSDHTQYLHTKEEGIAAIAIEKKHFPLFRTIKNGNQITVTLNGIMIKGQKNSEGKYHYIVSLKNGSSIKIQGTQVLVAEKNLQPNYIFDLLEEQLTVPNDGQQLRIDCNGESNLKRGGKIVNPLQQEQHYNEEDTLPADWIEPRLFIISNNETGVELLSQRQLQHYFAIREGDPNCNRFGKQVGGKNIVQLIQKNPSVEEVNAKHIKAGFQIDMDIFEIQEEHKKYHPPNFYTLRSFIKHQLLQEQDRRTVNQICSKTDAWRKQHQKEQNQFGFCPRDEQTVESRYNSKKNVLNYRKLNEPKLSTELLKKESMQQSSNKQKRKKTIIMQQAEQMKLKRSFSQRPKQIQGYRQIQLDQRPIQNLEEFSEEEGFYANYFITAQGKRALNAMPDWVFRAKSAKERKALDPQIVNQLNATMNRTNQKVAEQDKMEEIERERYDTVDINLSPQKQIIIQPSIFTKRQIDEERDAFEQEKKAYQYHEKKRKDFNVYCQERKNKIQVPSLMRTQPMSEINQKYLVTEAPLDRKVKISSMKNKLATSASSMIEMRKEGPHATLIRALDKKNNYDTLLEKRTMMVHADLNDKLQRDVLINPTQANFGNVQPNRTYEIKIDVKNQDIISQRLIVKKPRTVHVKTQMNQMGSIALGMTRKVSVFLKTSNEILGKFTDEFQIVTKHEIYHIPIIANVLSDDQFRNTGGLNASRVREVPNRVLKKGTEQLPPI